MKKARILKIALFSILIIIVFGECFYRLQFYEELKDQCHPLIYRTDNKYGYRYIPLTKSEISKPGIKKKPVNISKNGLYSPDFDAVKQKGIYRIVIVGASIASGIFMNGTYNYSQQLQSLYNKNNKKIEFINYSLDGRGMGLNLLEIVQNEVIHINPDLILMELNLPIEIGNMKRETYRGYLLQYYTDSTKLISKKLIDDVENKYILRFVYDYSFIFRGLCRWYVKTYPNTYNNKVIRTYRDKISRMESIEMNNFSFRKSIKLLQETDIKVREMNAGKFVLLSYGFDKYGVENFLKSKKLKSIFLKCSLENKYKSIPDSHPNELGHKLIADSLGKRLAENNFFR